jgi:starch synthase
VRVLFATAEFAPLARVGGLAAAAAGYVGELRRQGVDVEVVMPDYSGIALDGETIRSLSVPAWAGPAVARSGMAGSVPVTLIDLPGIRRSHPYLQPDGTGWHDNDHRFFAFSTAVAALVSADRPDIVHLNDWHTSAALAMLAAPPPTVLTIHTLGYQGHADPGWAAAFERPDAYLFGGAFNPLVGGIRLADLVVAVSPHYAQEIVTDAGGFGVAQILRDKGDRLVGILNGIDTCEWDPADDPHLAIGYDRSDLSPKLVLRDRLLAEVGLRDGGGPVIVVVTRLAEQKGIDLVVPVVAHLAGLGARMVVLGSGDRDLARALDEAAAVHPDVLAFVNGYDEGLAHRLFGGGDVLLMPSRFEPCGLAQMQAMRYGTLPLVTDVGGLHDTVIDIDASPSRGTGVVVPFPSAVAVMDGVHRMAKAFGQPRRRAAMRRRGMDVDWSWQQPTGRHIEWYRRLLERAP